MIRGVTGLETVPLLLGEATRKRFRPIARALVAFALAGGITAAAAESSALQTTEHEQLGAHLVDGRGMSLYVFLPDQAGPSTCYAQCADSWPPLLVSGPEGDIEAGEGIDENLIGITERTDGGLQASLNGWPLYYFAEDEEAGDTEGQGVGENWYLVSPEGTALGAPGEAEGDGDALATLMDEGRRVYANRCAQCHGEQGDQARDRVERLAGNDRAVRLASRMVRQVIFGGSYMPSFGDVLSDRQVSAVVTYVRNSWGHDHGVVTEEEVKAVREQFQ
jgi:predicted lipoprotein with Yx(FWY)xxD motif/cytochrome c5